MTTAMSGLSKARERGSSTAELAILLPVLLLTTVGIVDFGRIVSARNMLSNAARDATRYASVRSIDSEDPATHEAIRERVIAGLEVLDPAALEVETIWLPTNAPGNSVQVRLAYRFEPISPVMPIGLRRLSASSTMIISY
jgi:Flp pilus assembly protein TadG